MYHSDLICVIIALVWVLTGGVTMFYGFLLDQDRLSDTFERDVKRFKWLLFLTFLTTVNFVFHVSNHS